MGRHAAPACRRGLARPQAAGDHPFHDGSSSQAEPGPSGRAHSVRPTQTAGRPAPAAARTTP
jgi:hypothetical protein